MPKSFVVLSNSLIRRGSQSVCQSAFSIIPKACDVFTDSARCRVSNWIVKATSASVMNLATLVARMHARSCVRGGLTARLSTEVRSRAKRPFLLAKYCINRLARCHRDPNLDNHDLKVI